MATKINHGDRLEVGFPRKSDGTVLKHHYKAFEYASFASEQDDPEFWLTRQIRIGEAEHALNREDVGVSLLPADTVERIALEVGQVVDFNGTLYLLKADEATRVLRLAPVR